MTSFVDYVFHVGILPEESVQLCDCIYGTVTIGCDASVSIGGACRLC